MFMKQAVIRWLEWGGNPILGIMLLLFIVAAVAVILGVCFQKKKKYEEAFIVYKLLFGVGAAESCTVLLFGIFSQNVTILIWSTLAMILFILLFPIVRYCLQQQFLKNLISFCLQEMKRVSSVENSLTVYVFDMQIIIENLAIKLLVETPNSFSITPSQAKKWIAKMKGVKVLHDSLRRFYVTES